MKFSRIALIALALTLTLGTATAALAWHGDNGHGSSYDSDWGHNRGGHNRGWKHNGGHNAPTADVAYNAHGGGHERAADNKAIHEAEMKDGTHVDYSAPHRQNPNCEGMSGPHGRHLTDDTAPAVKK